MIITAGGGMAALLFSAAHFLTALSLAAVNVNPSMVIYLMMAAIITAGYAHLTIGEIYSQRYFSGA